MLFSTRANEKRERVKSVEDDNPLVPSICVRPDVFLTGVTWPDVSPELEQMFRVCTRLMTEAVLKDWAGSAEAPHALNITQQSSCPTVLFTWSSSLCLTLPCIKDIQERYNYEGEPKDLTLVTTAPSEYVQIMKACIKRQYKRKSWESNVHVRKHTY